MKYSAILVLITLATLVLAGCQVTTPGTNVTVTAPINIEINQTPTTTEGAEEAPEEEGIVIKATEGDLVQLRPEAYDPDKDVIHFYYTPPFNANGKWQTKEGDAGRYLVTITASDGKSNTSQDVIVIITKANQAPVLECPEEITAKEGELLKLDCNIYDPEGESVIVEYSGFMKSSTYQTTNNDAGDYTVQIKARDKEKEAETSVKIKIIDVNRAPEITGVPETINAVEGDVITLNPQVSDSDGDKVTVTFSEPFDKNGMLRTKIGDAGTIKASIVASDGKGTTKKEVTIVIAQKNTPPVLKTINDITVYEGETVTIPADASDREGDKLDITVKGWMNSLTYTTTYDDAGVYSVTVVVSDGTYTTEQTFQVTVLDQNRPPIFKIPA
ncbi:hypothetical protein JW756_04130 [Candidatus Woesearchaeota archaeon]|nr:hypothetical protein [Candidatus Woesearchaeota archaeon]